MQLINKMLEYTDLQPNNVYLCLGARTLKTSEPNKLIMGSGSALAMSKAIDGVQEAFADIMEPDSTGITLPLVRHRYDVCCIGLLVTRDEWFTPHDLNQIKESLAGLREVAMDTPNLTYHLPFPAYKSAIQDDVAELLGELPDNVLIYWA